LSTRHREIAFDPARMKIDEFDGFTRPIREGTRAVPDSRSGAPPPISRRKLLGLTIALPFARTIPCQ
jgi:hypothetical protein